MLRVVLHQGLAGLEERYQLVEEAQFLGTMGEVQVVVITSVPGDAYLQGGRALARWAVEELETCLPRTAIAPRRGMAAREP